VTHPGDTISRYCPLCSKPVTGLGARRVFIALAAAFVLAALVTFLGMTFFIASRFQSIP
jgi:hypothetical protein